MKKLEILKLVGKGALGAAGVLDPRIAMVSKGIEHLIKRDDNPANDIEETADALTEIFLNTVAVTEDLTHDVIDNAVLAEIAVGEKAHILSTLRLIRRLKVQSASG